MSEQEGPPTSWELLEDLSMQVAEDRLAAAKARIAELKEKLRKSREDAETLAAMHCASPPREEP